MNNPNRILLAGDTHGQIWQIDYLIEQVKRFDVDAIIQLGDFGYWEHTYEGVGFLKLLEEALAEVDIPFYWLDGNHENHPLLWYRYLGIVSDNTIRQQKLQRLSKYLDNNYGNTPHQIEISPEGFARMREHLWYIPRGTSWTWHDKKFLAVGGAFSIDRNQRRIGQSYWFEETITDDDVERAISQEHCDIMLSHDAPQGVAIEAIFGRSGKHYTQSPESEANRRKVRKIVDEVKPSHLYHGHYHFYYYQDLTVAFGNHRVKVKGLGCDGMDGDSFTVIDLKKDFNV